MFTRSLIRIAPVVLLLLSVLGFADATYLTERHYDGLAVGCIALGGCDQVTASAYATVGNVPIALLGAGYYGVILGLVAGYLFLSRRRGVGGGRVAEALLNFTARFTVIGFLVSLWLVYLQLFVIKAVCVYCMVSAATATLLFLFGTLLLYARRGLREEEIAVE